MKRANNILQKIKIEFCKCTSKVKERVDNLIDNLSEDEITNEFQSINLMKLSHGLQKMKNCIDGEFESFDENIFNELEHLQESLNTYIAVIYNQKNKLQEELAVIEKIFSSLNRGKRIIRIG